MVRTFAENTTGDPAFVWLASVSYTAKRGSLLPTREHAAVRQDYGRMVLEDRLRDTLLPNLLSDELRVRNAEKLPEVLI